MFEYTMFVVWVICYPLSVNIGSFYYVRRLKMQGVDEPAPKNVRVIATLIRFAIWVSVAVALWP